MATDQTVGKIFYKACKHGKVEKVRQCIGLEVDVNCAKPVPGLIKGSANNHYQVVDLLLQQPGIDVNIRGGSFIRGGSNNYTALHVACEKNNIEIVRRLLSRADIDVNAATTSGYTALHGAAQEGHVDCVEMLLDCSALDVNKKKSNGNAAIALAVCHNHREAVELLMRDRRTDLKIRDEDNNTLVQLAV